MNVYRAYLELNSSINDYLGGSRPKTSFFTALFFVCLLLCSFICLQAVYQFSGPVCKSTWKNYPSYSASHLHFHAL